MNIQKINISKIQRLIINQLYRMNTINILIKTMMKQSIAVVVSVAVDSFLVNRIKNNLKIPFKVEQRTKIKIYQITKYQFKNRFKIREFMKIIQMIFSSYQQTIFPLMNSIKTPKMKINIIMIKLEINSKRLNHQNLHLKEDYRIINLIISVKILKIMMILLKK